MANHSSTVTSSETGRNGAPCFVFDEPAIKALRVIAYCIIILGSFAGNSILLAVLWRGSKRKRTTNYLIANMATADLVITLVYMPRMIAVAIYGYEWLVGGTLGLVLCKLVAFSHYISLLVSIQTLVVLSLERFLVIYYPLRIPFTALRAKTIIAVIWLLAILARLPLFLGLQTERKGEGLRCRDRLNEITGNSKSREIYDHVLGIVFYAVPVVIITVLYTAAAYKLRRTNTAGGDNHQRTSQKNHVFAMLVIITLAFVLCWLAYFVARKGVVSSRSLPCDVLFIRSMLAHLNSAVTPCIYAIFSKRYRAMCKKVSGYFCCQVSPTRLFLKTRVLPLGEARRESANLPRKTTEAVVLQNFHCLTSA